MSFVTYLVFVLSNLNGMVLCFENDGRVSLEAGYHGVCSDYWSELHQSAATSPQIASQDACKHCTDIPVNLETDKSARLVAHDVQVADAVPQLSVFSPLLISFISPTQGLSSLPPPEKPKLHQLLESVVLLI